MFHKGGLRTANDPHNGFVKRAKDKETGGRHDWMRYNVNASAGTTQTLARSSFFAVYFCNEIKTLHPRRKVRYPYIHTKIV